MQLFWGETAGAAEVHVLLTGLWCCPWISLDQRKMFCAQWYLCGDFWERQRMHHNPSHALQVIRPFLEKVVLVVQSQQGNLKIPRVMARVPQPTVVISLYSKKHEVKWICIRNLSVCELQVLSLSGKPENSRQIPFWLRKTEIHYSDKYESLIQSILGRERWKENRWRRT